MSRIVSQFLGKPETQVSLAVNRLEDLSGSSSEDVRLIANMSRELKNKIPDLGLDGKDTTSRELYHALLARLENDENNLKMLIGLNKGAITADNFVHRVITFTNYAKSPNSVWVLKRSVVKNLLRNHNPYKTMKYLHYRSIDSMLKREDVSEIMAAAAHLESQRWQKKLMQEMSMLMPSDFELRDANTIIMSSKKWGNLAIDLDPNVELIAYLGSIVIWSSERIKNLECIGLSLLITQNLAKLRTFSAIVKLRQMEANFGSMYVQLLQKGVAPAFKINHLPVSWQAVFQHYGKLFIKEQAELSDPSISKEDLIIHKPSEALAKLSPRLKWWSELDHIAMLDGEKPISFNIADVFNNLHRKTSFEKRTVEHFRQSFWHELIGRYLSFSPVRELATVSLINPEWQSNSSKHTSPQNVSAIGDYQRVMQ